MKAVLSALAIARAKIKANPLKKDGRNTFSNYDYFTPELVNKLVTDGCNESNLIAVFNLKHDEHGFFGEVILTEMESGESIITIMRTACPNIKATNETQQMGGMNTYAKRYALMSLFDIEDNQADFDSHDNTKVKQKEIQPLETSQPDLPWLNKFLKDKVTITEDWGNVKRGINKGFGIADVAKKFKISKELRAELQELINERHPA